MRAAPRRLSFLPLLAVVFFNVSGGPYGVEDAVSVFGPGLTLLLLALTPLLGHLRQRRLLAHRLAPSPTSTTLPTIS